MTREQFWKTIDAARSGTSASDPSASPESLTEVLAELPVEEIQSFMTHFHSGLVELNQWRLWGAGYVIAGGMSDDSFHYFRSWIIGKGKAAFDQALADPDLLGPWIDDPEVENELLEYAAMDVLEVKGVEDDPRDGFTESPDDDPKGEQFDEETVAESYPRLAGQFG